MKNSLLNRISEARDASDGRTNVERMIASAMCMLVILQLVGSTSPSFAQTSNDLALATTVSGANGSHYVAPMPDNNLLPNVPQPCTVMFHGLVQCQDISTGSHKLRVRIYDEATGEVPPATLLHEESMATNITRGGYDITMNEVAPAVCVRGEQLVVGVSIDNKAETLWPVSIQRAKEFARTDVYVANLDQKRLEIKTAESQNTGVGTSAIADQSNPLSTPLYGVREIDPMTGNVKIKTLSEYSGSDAPTPPSFRLEYGVAGPMNLQYNTSSMMQYGRASVDVMNLATVLGSHLGLGARMMRSGGDFRYYSGGIVADVNNDGSVLATIGVAKYQSGTDLSQPYTISPFSRIQYFTSTRGVFLYGDVEATVHVKGYISGTAGLGVKVAGIELIAGYHYSMYVLPDVVDAQTVTGFNTIASITF